MVRRAPAGGSRERTGSARAAAGVDLDDEGFRRGIAEWWSTIQVNGPRDLMRLGQKMRGESMKLCPVDTGRLRSSITVTQGRDGKGFFVDVGTNVEYASYVEYGTARSPAQPFIRPAYILAGQWWADIARGG